ncbi:hypothetical protein M885DRAFT_303703 [Pelagophyceae sp. CCMP2097]|nr:hypothetical protein M885DRAFT_303703 [Pelagophyceae sp. CCMP2097]
MVYSGRDFNLGQTLRVAGLLKYQTRLLGFGFGPRPNPRVYASAETRKSGKPDPQVEGHTRTRLCSYLRLLETAPRDGTSRRPRFLALWPWLASVSAPLDALFRLALYTDGHEMAWHTDAPHGPWAYVISLTPDGFHGRADADTPAFFDGGETCLLRPKVLDLWRNFDAQRGLEVDNIVEKFDPQPFGRSVWGILGYSFGASQGTGAGNVYSGRVSICAKPKGSRVCRATQPVFTGRVRATARPTQRRVGQNAQPRQTRGLKGKPERVTGPSSDDSSDGRLDGLLDISFCQFH